MLRKHPFVVLKKKSAVEHMNELSTLSSLFSDDIKKRTYFVAKFFPFSLKDYAKTWYNSLPPDSIDSPSGLLDVFFGKTFLLVLNILLCRKFIVLTRKMERNCLKLGQDFALLSELGLDMIWKSMIS